MIYTVTLNPAIDRELTVPHLAYDTVLRASGRRIDFGGKGFNVSRMLRAMGRDSCALGFVGGKSGEILRDGLRALDIETDFVWVAGETRTNISIVTSDHGHYLKANEPGPEVPASRQAELLERVKDLVCAGDWWVLAGSLPPGVSETMYAEMVKVIEAGGAHSIQDASGPALAHGCQAGAYLVKPNAEEAETLSGMVVQTVEDAVRAAARIREMGARVVIISLGRLGAVLSTEQHSWLACSPPMKEGNPIGAGDALVGGVVWALSLGESLSEALRWGVACGAAAAGLDGTAVGGEEFVRSLHEQVRLRVLE